MKDILFIFSIKNNPNDRNKDLIRDKNEYFNLKDTFDILGYNNEDYKLDSDRLIKVRGVILFEKK